jgi:hypothetical protein
MPGAGGLLPLALGEIAGRARHQGMDAPPFGRTV